LQVDQAISAQGDETQRLKELVGLLYGMVQSTGAAPEEFWNDVAFPYALIGQPTQFAPLDAEELAAVKQGVSPFLIYLEAQPHLYPVSSDEALMGVFDVHSLRGIQGLDKGMSAPRLLAVQASALKPALAAFDAKANAEKAAAFRTTAWKQAEKSDGVEPKEVTQMQEAAAALLTQCSKVLESGHTTVMRRMTEAEAASEAAFAQLRQALTGPRIILSA
jgi:hypothetical protein